MKLALEQKNRAADRMAQKAQKAAVEAAIIHTAALLNKRLGKKTTMRSKQK